MQGKPIIEMFWVAEYDDGQALTQFQFDHFSNSFTPFENRFEQVDWKKTVRLWWMPVTLEIMLQISGTRCNPRLVRHCVETKGSKGFVARRVVFDLPFGGNGDKPRLRQHRVKCYVLGIEGGPRREIYPDGTVVDKEWPEVGASQDILHHG